MDREMEHKGERERERLSHKCVESALIDTGEEGMGMLGMGIGVGSVADSNQMITFSSSGCIPTASPLFSPTSRDCHNVFMGMTALV